MPRTINYLTENERQTYLEALYRLDGRDDPTHPHFSTYTGLYQQRQQQLMAEDVIRLMDRRLPPPAPERQPIVALELPLLTHNAIRRAGYSYIDEIEALTDEQILTIRTVGPTGLAHIRAALASYSSATAAA